MKTTQIKDAINNMLCDRNNISTVLIDGQWGIGKTHAVLSELKNNKSCRYAYASFFGKKSIDEINTELYQQLNKSEKVLHTISSIVSLIGASVSFSGIGINLNGTTFESKRKIKKRKNNIIVVLDDLERRSNEITSNDLLGYINQLSLQGIKILVLSNLKENLNENLGEFKEKVFDRIYEINETPLEIAQKLVSQKDSVDDKCLKLVANNLRMIIKANSLYNQIEEHILQHSTELKYEVPFRYCLYIVEESLNNTITTQYQQLEGKWITEAYPNVKTRRIPAICYYENIEYENEIENSLLITAIFNVFEQNDFSLLDEILFFTKKEPSILLNEIFYLSDEDKTNIIKQQYDYIINHATASELKFVVQAIRNWHQHAYYMDLNFIDKNALFDTLYKFGCTYMEPSLADETFCDFLKEYNAFFNQKDVEELKTFFNDTKVYSKEFYDKLAEITQNYLNYSQLKKDAIKSILLANSFYMYNLGDSINENIWRTIHRIGYIVKERIPELKQELLKYFESIKNEQPNNKTLNQRINVLEKQYLIN